jgi:hypothetical protein
MTAKNRRRRNVTEPMEWRVGEHGWLYRYFLHDDRPYILSRHDAGLSPQERVVYASDMRTARAIDARRDAL